MKLCLKVEQNAMLINLPKWAYAGLYRYWIYVTKVIKT